MKARTETRCIGWITSKGLAHRQCACRIVWASRDKVRRTLSHKARFWRGEFRIQGAAPRLYLIPTDFSRHGMNREGSYTLQMRVLESFELRDKMPVAWWVLQLLAPPTLHQAHHLCESRWFSFIYNVWWNVLYSCHLRCIRAYQGHLIVKLNSVRFSCFTQSMNNESRQLHDEASSYRSHHPLRYGHNTRYSI